MSERLREVCEFYENHTASETAKKFGLSINTVRQYKVRLQKKEGVKLPDKRYPNEQHS